MKPGRLKFLTLPRIPLAWYNLLHDRNRLGVAIAGVTFAVLLMFMNLGFLGALVNTTTNFYDQFNGDIFLLSPGIPRNQHHQSISPRAAVPGQAGIEGVEQVMPLYAEYALWKNPETLRQSGHVCLWI
jgi:putative ABC transport system permease protein